VPLARLLSDISGVPVNHTSESLSEGAIVHLSDVQYHQAIQSLRRVLAADKSAQVIGMIEQGTTVVSKSAVNNGGLKRTQNRGVTPTTVSKSILTNSKLAKLFLYL